MKNFIILMGYLSAVMVNAVMVLTFFTAFFNGGCVLITINNCNEMYIESIVIPVFFIISITGLTLYVKRM